MNNDELVYTVNAPHFNAGIVVLQNTVVRAAPIIRYMLGWGLDKVKIYCARKYWTCEL